MEVIAIDLFGPLPPASTGERWILIIEDYATRWIELFALVDATADRCAWTFVNEVCLGYGDPPEPNLGQWHPVYNKRHYAKNLLLSRDFPSLYY
jgi:hypothetical protein